MLTPVVGPANLKRRLDSFRMARARFRCAHVKDAFSFPSRPLPGSEGSLANYQPVPEPCLPGCLRPLASNLAATPPSEHTRRVSDGPRHRRRDARLRTGVGAVGA